MANDARNRKNVLFGIPDVKASGGIEIGKVATKSEIPTDATKGLPEALAVAAVGYVSPDGLTKTVDRQIEKIKDWFGDTVEVATSEHDVSLKLTVMEAGNAPLLKTIYGEENVKIKGENLTLIDNAGELPHNSWNFQMKGKAGVKIRVFAPDAQVTNVGDVKFVKSDVIKYELELTCYTDEEANKLYQFIDRDEASPAPASEAA